MGLDARDPLEFDSKWYGDEERLKVHGPSRNDTIPELEPFVFTRPSWQSQAACKDMGNDPYYIEKHTGVDRATLARCAGCPVRLDCLAFGLHDKYGVWGGFGPKTRRKIVRGELGTDLVLPEPPQCGTVPGYNTGCRCEPCRLASRGARRERRKRAAAA